MRNERLPGNAHVLPAITNHLSARNSPVRHTPTRSLQETAKMAETDRSTGSYLLTPSKQKTNVPLLILSWAGEVGWERAWVGQGETAGVDGHFG